MKMISKIISKDIIVSYITDRRVLISNKSAIMLIKKSVNAGFFGNLYFVLLEVLF